MTNPPGAMPPLPEPFGHIHDGNGNQPLSFDRGPIPWERSIGCSTQEVYSFAQLQAYAAPFVARVAELEQTVKVWENEAERRSRRYESCTARVAELQAALTDALNAMEMQDKREAGEFHIPQATAIGIWRDAQALARAAITPTKD